MNPEWQWPELAIPALANIAELAVDASVLEEVSSPCWSKPHFVIAFAKTNMVALTNNRRILDDERMTAPHSLKGIHSVSSTGPNGREIPQRASLIVLSCDEALLLAGPRVKLIGFTKEV